MLSLKFISKQNALFKFNSHLGFKLITSNITNKQQFFNEKDRQRYQIKGLLPPKQLNIEDQYQIYKEEYYKGIIQQFRDFQKEQGPVTGVTENMIRKWLVLKKVQEIDLTLYYYLIRKNIKELSPIIYTPTVGWICQYFSRLKRKSHGLYLSYDCKGNIQQIINNWPYRDIQAIVITDGSRILGLGDLGINGMGIPIGKLDLYIAAGGFQPKKVLPIVVDIGTNNEQNLQSDSYLGLKQKRISQQDYVTFMDEIITSLTYKWPNILIQFEDFKTEYANFFLERYRKDFLFFNDDIQGTAAVVLAGIFGALKTQNENIEALKHLKAFIMGAGSAGIGVANILLQYKVRLGLSEQEAKEDIFLFDQKGLITSNRKNIQDNVGKYAKDFALKNPKDLVGLIKKIKPEILIGLTAQKGAFTKEIVQSINENCQLIRPIIFPLSNPTSNAEATFKEIMEYTNYRAIFGAGSPFQPIEFKQQTYRANQTNNSYIFPGLTFGAYLGQFKYISDEVIIKAAETLSECLKESDIKEVGIFPDYNNILDISSQISTQVILKGLQQGLVQNSIFEKELQGNENKILSYIKSMQWNTMHRNYTK